MSDDAHYILTLACPDTTGIVAAVSGFLADNACNIVQAAQFGDSHSGRFFMRVSFLGSPLRPDRASLAEAFAPLATRFAMDWHLYDLALKPRMVIMVSKFGHCLNDLLYRYRVGALKVEIPAVISNHRDFYQLVAGYNIPFHYLPIINGDKAAQEARVYEVIEQEQADLVVLARYMQVLSDDLCRKLAGRAINIHHSFLPSFKGAKPYHQAYERGVKRIGATAHYVTSDLDEGPIIEQEVAPVSHAMTPDDFIAVGRDLESVVLARAVKAHLERRVLLNGQRTIVFA
ncbi:formyltetrahydrofolate deformylase [Plasticicumulans lactativorans]|uniref:Formyltetrahydrofolate deformylase n=1 Tax=Plasticicumulans lactativorans TaxID=1133106 RepID=A0A4V2SC62_9GAMM|nr:formyltetrahydrofolate deformylase [Plasticicumulans lactativorans]TCO78160.1 formyltetrahydrofolate deformylase [Plasticicumulans lactativorans]